MSSAPLVVRWRLAFANPKNKLHRLTRLVLHTISLFMAMDGSRGFPSMTKISQWAGMSVRAVKGHIKLAENGGWIEKQFAGFGGQGWRHYLYVPHIPPGAENNAQITPRSDDKTAEGGAQFAPRLPEGGARIDTKVVHSLHPNYTTNNPVKNNYPVGAASAPSPPAVQSHVHDVSKKKSKAKRGHKTALPADFVLTPALREFAVSKGFSGDVDSLFEACCDYYRGNGKQWVDWSAVWRNWVRKEIKFQEESKNGQRVSGPRGGAFSGKGRKGQGANSGQPATPGKYDGLGVEMPN
jgi:hypothetical protein